MTISSTLRHSAHQIESSANEKKSKSGPSLLNAVDENNVTLALQLIEKGADFLAVDAEKFNVVHTALYRRNFDLAITLITAAKKSGVVDQLLTQVTRDGSTVLHFAARYLHYRTASVLLSISPAISYFLLTHKDNAGETASIAIDTRDEFSEPLESVSQEPKKSFLRKLTLKTRKITNIPKEKSLDNFDKLDSAHKGERSSIKERPQIYRVIDSGKSARTQVLESRRRILNESRSFLQKIVAAIEMEREEERALEEEFAALMAKQIKTKMPVGESLPSLVVASGRYNIVSLPVAKECKRVTLASNATHSATHAFESAVVFSEPFVPVSTLPLNFLDVFRVKNEVDTVVSMGHDKTFTFEVTDISMVDLKRSSPSLFDHEYERKEMDTHEEMDLDKKHDESPQTMQFDSLYAADSPVSDSEKQVPPTASPP